MIQEDNIIPTVDEITEKVVKVLKYQPQEDTEKVPYQKRQTKIIRKYRNPQYQSEETKEPYYKTKKQGYEKDFEEKNTYESLLSEIKPNMATTEVDRQVVDTNDFYFPRSKTDLDVYDEELSITIDEDISKTAPKNALLKKVYLTLGMIKFQHSIFALPFALTSVFVATAGNPGVFKVLLILFAMITARNSAMTFNRIVDRHIDKKNPRTRDRAIPSGELSLRFAFIFGLINMILFVFTSMMFNKLTFILSPLALAIILGYSLTKRFTYYTQFYLGLALGCAPVAAWIAMTGVISVFSVVLGMAVFLWVAGFDIIYSTLDYDFDRQYKLKSLVVHLGLRKALWLAGFIHLLSVIFFVCAGFVQGLHIFYYLGCLLTALLLIYEHRLVKPYDLSRVNMAFFTLNGYVSLFFLVFVLLDIYVIG
ncbi:MAG: 4-hydroxybenzoate octaprenyltransferase [bacterium]|nr:putative 4-hydroxybenzoate polyprenyltransferase [bacterium]